VLLTSRRDALHDPQDTPLHVFRRHPPLGHEFGVAQLKPLAL
jgi:hypothetical protein